MKINRIPFLFAIVLASAVGAPTFSRYAQRKQPRNQGQMPIYLPRDGDSSRDNPFNLQPVLRAINSTAPARSALEALLAGPTAAEQNSGFRALDTEDISITSLTVKNGEAHVSFERRGGERWAGDLAPATFRQAVERTLRQFPTVRRVIICVDGYRDFDSDIPSKKCQGI